MRITLLRKHFTSQVAWAVSEEDKVGGYIELHLYLTRETTFHFCCSVADKSFCGRNPIDCLLRALESESVGMAKYNALKERLREREMWRKL